MNLSSNYLLSQHFNFIVIFLQLLPLVCCTVCLVLPYWVYMLYFCCSCVLRWLWNSNMCCLTCTLTNTQWIYILLNKIIIMIIIIIIIILLCYVSSCKNMWVYVLGNFITYTRNISYVQFPLAIFEIGHCTMFIFWSKVSAFCASNYLGAYQCHNEGWRRY